MKKKAVIEENIELVTEVQKIAKRDSDTELLLWANGVRQALEWIINNSDDSSIGIAKCNLAQELEIMKIMEKWSWREQHLPSQSHITQFFLRYFNNNTSKKFTWYFYLSLS